jgi:hypothetical protein
MGLVQYDSSDEDEEATTPVDSKVRFSLTLTRSLINRRLTTID